MVTNAIKMPASAEDIVEAEAPFLFAGTTSAESANRLDYAQILRSAGEAAYEWQIESDRLIWSDNAPALFGLRGIRRMASGRAYANLIAPGSGQTRFDVVFQPQDADGGNGVAYQIQYELRTGARSPRLWVEDTGRWFADNNSKPLRAQGLVRIINDRYEREQQLAHLSRIDILTGEINRAHLIEQIELALQFAVRTQTSCGFFLVAIDNLARINESYGYDVADEVIGVVAKRLRSRMRAEDCLGRASGNKFGIILGECAADDMRIAAERFLSSIRDDVVITSAGPVSVTGTIGAVVAPRQAANVHQVLARAQETLDRAKKKHPGSFLAYMPSVEREAIRRANILATDQIVTALNERRIELAYEPVADAHTREIVFHECLLRIRRTDGSLIPALDVIPIAERLGLVRLLDQRVLELAIEEMAAHRDLKASLNVSASSTMDPDWWSSLEALLRLHEHVAARLIIEITETAAIHDIENAREFVFRVKDLGARIAIDDFGAGYTSFRNLRKLGVDMIKIDGAFIERLVRSDDDRSFVRAMIDLGRRLNLKTVAEWVQDEQTAAILAAWGCDYLQGMYIGCAARDRPALVARPPQRRTAQVRATWNPALT